MRQRNFLQFLIEAKALKFGDFVTKSGRRTPYFFNFGEIATGRTLGTVANFYADELIGIKPKGIKHLYGPAYKGISLSVLLADRLYERNRWDVKVSFNRKELKDHGEKGSLIGERIGEGDNVWIVEDVLTAGTSVRESVSVIRSLGANVEGVLVGVDRMEKGLGSRSAKEEIETKLMIPVFSILNMDQIISLLSEPEPIFSSYLCQNDLLSVKNYYSEFCVS